MDHDKKLTVASFGRSGSFWTSPEYVTGKSVSGYWAEMDASIEEPSGHLKVHTMVTISKESS
jgi:hypothetical protein